MNKIFENLKNHAFSIILLLSIILGGITGLTFGEKVFLLKPFGEIFLNLMFTVVIPLVFFSIASSVASMQTSHQFGKIVLRIMGVFLFMGIIAALYMLIVSTFFPPGQNFVLTSALHTNVPEMIPTKQHFLDLFTVSNFSALFSREHMLALMIFAVLIGCSVSAVGKAGKPFADFLESGMAIFMKMTGFIMYYAPIGFFAYFAVLVAELGSQVIGAYVRIGIIYYIAAFIYFIVGFSFFVWLARNGRGVDSKQSNFQCGAKSIKTFWQYALPPSITAFATCSSAASIPVNLEAAEKMGIDPAIYKAVIPLGTIIHKQGSILGGIVKISFLFTFFHLPFSDAHTLLTAVAVALLVGTVMGAIPSGGMLGEMLIISIYGFPPETLMLIAVISLIIDPPATLLNVTGNTVASLLVDRWRFKLK